MKRIALTVFFVLILASSGWAGSGKYYYKPHKHYRSYSHYYGPWWKAKKYRHARYRAHSWCGVHRAYHKSHHYGYGSPRYEDHSYIKVGKHDGEGYFQIKIGEKF